MSTDPAADAGAVHADGLLAYCRPGFEPELAAELSERAGLAGLGFVLSLGLPRLLAPPDKPFLKEKKSCSSTS